MKLILQGREIGAPELVLIRSLIRENPGWSRFRLSRELCQRWDWRNGAGRIKDMASRTLLGRLEKEGHIELPPLRPTPHGLGHPARMVPMEWDRQEMECPLKEVSPLQIAEVSRDRTQRRQVAAALAQFHYLGFGSAVGENLQYTVRGADGRLLACLVFGSAAWKCQDRDCFIGWTPEQRRRHLERVASNSRFLILPWVRVPHLASHVLGVVLRQISKDWQAKYGHGIDLVETFVERDRFRGTAYRAANWLRAGQTTGRTRQDRDHRIQAPIKDVYLYPLGRQFRQHLCQ